MKINKVMEDREIHNETWDNLELKNVSYYHYFWKDMKFNKVLFNNCMFMHDTFVNCEFNNCAFIECRFIKNVYKNVELKDVKVKNTTDNLTLGCEVNKK